MKPFLFVIPGQMPGLNEIISAAKKQKGGYSPYNDMKESWHEVIEYSIREQYPSLPVYARVFIEFSWFEKTLKRDPDNIAAGGRKFILDTIVSMGIIPNDTHRFIAGWSDTFSKDKNNPRIEVKIIPDKIS